MCKLYHLGRAFLLLLLKESKEYYLKGIIYKYRPMQFD